MKDLAASLHLIRTDRRSSAWFWLLLALFTLPVKAEASCFYDGVSQTSVLHLIEQLSERYQRAAVTADSQWLDVPINQPLGDCPLEEFLTLATDGSDWRYRLGQAGVVFSYHPLVKADADTVEPVTTAAGTGLPAAEEVLVKGVQFASQNDIAARYASNSLLQSASLPTGELAGNNTITAALGRQAAVTFTQEAGNDRNISVRGLSSDFTRVTVNGMPMLATGTSIDARGSVNNSRSFDFNVIPQGLFNHISIIKSSSARSTEGAIGGAVDMSTPKPFNSDGLLAGGRQQWLTLQPEQNVRNGSGGAAVLAGVQGISEDGELGWHGAISFRKRTTSEKGFSTVRWQQADWGEQSQLSDEQQQQLDDGVFSPRHNRYDILNRELTTLGATGVLQWRKQPWGDLDLTLVASHHKQELHEYHITSAGLRLQDLSDITVNDFELGSQGMVYGSFSNVDIRSEHNHELDITDLAQLSLDWRRQLSERWQLRSQLGYQASIFYSPLHTNISLLSEAQDFSYDLRSNGRIAVNHYGFDINDPDEWQLWRITLQNDQVVNRYQVGQLEAEFRQTPLLTHWFGASYQGFTNDRQQSSYTYSSDNGDSLGYTTSTPDNYASGFGVRGLPSKWVVARQGLVDALGLTDDLLEKDPTQQRQLRETSWAGWWQSGFEFWQLGWPLRGDVGMRYARTRQQVTGAMLMSDEDNSTAPVDAHFAYADWLPSLHLVAQADDDLLIRLGYSREISRPSIDSLTSPLLLRSSARIVESGNIQLHPSRAHAFDLGLEWYGDQQTLLAAGLFYTRIDSLIMEQSSTITLDQLPYYNPLWQTLDNANDDGGEYELRQPVNGPGTDITGLELNLQLPFSLLPAPLNRLGIDASYAFSKAVTRYLVDEGHQTLPPPGLSRHVFNGALWYRQPAAELGLTLRARSRYLTEVPGNNGNDREGVNASAILGAYARWHYDSQLTISLDANNLTNEAFDEFVDKTNRVYSYSVTGTEVQLGLSWRFGDS
ncbi:TonB-dependent receptor [Oceanobacter mangrovi]|uniref:TonB-dependent receptor n=1 Tax=Oceanobacter mangrovi TaxID=2862510 RepID=UPI001C8E9A0A|nr:TonB-dependent receptor [Oceanobacter mangrovi]